MSSRTPSDEKRWAKFAQDENLAEAQLTQFQRYYQVLMEENERANLTAITALKQVLHHHFSDSLMLRKFTDLTKHAVIVDVGAGAGFPAIPLKIVYPHLAVLLIEVTHKKQLFLKRLVEELELENVEICPLDWRTFLRTTEGEADLFVSRAALDVVELCRLFRHTSAYRDAQLVYWASEQWAVPAKGKEYVERMEEYSVGHKQRKLVFLRSSKTPS